MSDVPVAPLAALVAAGAKATPGPVDAPRQDDDGGLFWWDVWSAEHGSVAHVSEGARPIDRMRFARRDAEFIAAAFNARPALAALLAEVEWLRRRVGELEEQRDVAQKIIDERDRVLDAIPCPVHGRCVPHALEWIKALRPEPA